MQVSAVGQESSPAAAAAELRGPAMGGVMGSFPWEQAGHILFQPHCCWKLQAADAVTLHKGRKGDAGQQCGNMLPWAYF